MKELLSNVGSGGGGPAQAVAAGGATGAAPAAAAEEEVKKEEEKEESDEDMVCFFLFPCSDLWLTGDSFRASVFSINPFESCSSTPLRVQMYLYSSMVVHDYTRSQIDMVPGYTTFFVDSFTANLPFNLSWEPALFST